MNTTNNADLLGNYSLADAAKILGCDGKHPEHSVRTRIKENRLPGVISGRHYKVRKAVTIAAAEGLVVEDLFAMDRQLADGGVPSEVLAYWLKHGRRQQAPELHGTAAKRARSPKKATRRGAA